MTVRFYTDEHVSYVVVRALRQRGVDVLAVAEAGMLGETDEAHLRRAHEEGRVLFSQDQDFLALHARGLPHAGIAYAPRQAPFRRVLDGLLLIHAVLDAEDMVGRLEFL